MRNNRKVRWLAVAIGIIGFTTLGRTQDAVQVAPKNFTVLQENEEVRVVQDTLAPGETEAKHTHPAGWYYVAMPGTMKVMYADGRTTTWIAKTGEQAWMDAEPAHTSENIGKTTIQYVLVEVKSAAKNAHSR